MTPLEIRGATLFPPRDEKVTFQRPLEFIASCQIGSRVRSPYGREGITVEGGVYSDLSSEILKVVMMDGDEHVRGEWA